MFAYRLLIQNIVAQESFGDLVNVFSREVYLSRSTCVKHMLIVFNAEIASSSCLTATALGTLVGSNVIAGAFSRSPYVALDDIFGQVRFPFSCFFLFMALPRQSRSRTSHIISKCKIYEIKSTIILPFK